MATTHLPPHLRLLDSATPAHLPSLATIHTRSFHPDNRFHMEVLPDSPQMREWWRRQHAASIEDPASRVLVVVDDGKEAGDEDAVVGILRLRRFEADEPGMGVFDMTPCEGMDVARMEEIAAPSAEGRMKVCGERRHLLVEFLGVDRRFHRSGVGRALLTRVGEISDADGLDTFVDANYLARAFYEKFGFEAREEIVMSGEDKYTIYAMLRPSKKTT